MVVGFHPSYARIQRSAGGQTMEHDIIGELTRSKDDGSKQGEAQSRVLKLEEDHEE